MEPHETTGVTEPLPFVADSSSWSGKTNVAIRRFFAKQAGTDGAPEIGEARRVDEAPPESASAVLVAAVPLAIAVACGSVFMLMWFSL